MPMLRRWHFLYLKVCQFNCVGIILDYTLVLINKIYNHMALKIKPLADRVLIEPVQAETKTASGIIIPDNAKEKPQKGTVAAVGKGTKDEQITVKVGDTVLYGKYAGTELKLEGTDYLIMRESDILAII
jgi:chaperonin GroES